MRHFHKATNVHFSKFIGLRVAFAAMLVPAMAMTGASAAELAISAGGSSTASQLWAPAVYIDVAGERRPLGSIAWQPVASVGVIGGRDERADLDRTVAVGGVGVRLVDWWKRAFFSFQLGYANRETAALSSRGQFISSLGWQGDRTVWMLRHISNGNIYGGKNLGETMLLFGFRF